MAFWVKDTFAKVWEIKANEKYADVRISTSEKDNREEGKYINSNWFGRCVGKAYNQIAKINEKDSIKIISGKVTNEGYKDKDGNNKSALRVTIFEIEDANSGKVNKAESKSKKKEKTKSEEEVSDEELPF